MTLIRVDVQPTSMANWGQPSNFGCIHTSKVTHEDKQFMGQIKPSKMEVAPLHRTVDITQKRVLFKNTKKTKKRY